MFQSKAKITYNEILQLALEGAKSLKAKAFKDDDPVLAISFEAQEMEIERRIGISRRAKGKPWSAARHEAQAKINQETGILSWPQVKPKAKT